MKTLLLAATAAMLAVAPASAATIFVTDSGTTPNQLTLDFIPIGTGTFTGGSSDTVVSAGNSLRNYSVTYNFTAPADGNGSISFTTTSVAPALLSITSASFNGTPVTITTGTGANGAVTYNGFFDFTSAMFGDAFALTLGGEVRRGGTLSTSLSYAASTGVPEPATWGLMILGFGAVGGAMRRRRTATLATA